MDTTNWFNDKGDYTHRLNYNLNKDSVVFDLGGYKGWFTDHMNNKFGCNIYCYEPVPDFAHKITSLFWGNTNIFVYNYGISNENKKETISVQEEATSLHLKGVNNVEIECITLDKAMTVNKVEFIDLLKINIEGEEYPLLEYMIENGLTVKCQNIQVQFHEFINGYAERYDKIKNELEKTHRLTYRYPFVWENWEKI